MESTILQGILWAIWLLVVANAMLPEMGFPGIALSIPTVTAYRIEACAYVFPIFLLCHAFRMNQSGWRTFNLVAGGLLSVFGLLGAHSIITKYIPRFQQSGVDIFFQELEHPQGLPPSIKVYRLSYGGGTGADFLVRQEIELPGPLKLVRSITTEKGGEFQLGVNKVDSNTLEIENDYSKKKRQVRIPNSFFFPNLGGV